jgi:hypothetical protein
MIGFVGTPPDRVVFSVPVVPGHLHHRRQGRPCVQDRRLAGAFLLQHYREQAVDRLPGDLGDPLYADVRDDVQGQVPGVSLLAVRLDVVGAEECLHVHRERHRRLVGRAGLGQLQARVPLGSLGHL